MRHRRIKNLFSDFKKGKGFSISIDAKEGLADNSYYFFKLPQDLHSSIVEHDELTPFRNKLYSKSGRGWLSGGLKRFKITKDS